MHLGVPRHLRLTSAKATWLLDCKAAGLSKKTVQMYDDVLTGFIVFAGDMLVCELGPDHVRFYVAELADRPGHYVGQPFTPRSLMKHYAVIRTWIRWMYAQKIIEERITDYVKPPRLSSGIRFIMSDQEVDASVIWNYSVLSS